ncbi:hypothetical protein VTK73DRAFT_4365 [Phialemonium thermophilum]|uniref:Uncharacterized protein n=1 Tax=Phialemonium thermophilum TaxID=223376 RepID=A0ABR3XZB0_9PEZI
MSRTEQKWTVLVATESASIEVKRVVEPSFAWSVARVVAEPVLDLLLVILTIAQYDDSDGSTCLSFNLFDGRHLETLGSAPHEGRNWHHPMPSVRAPTYPHTQLLFFLSGGARLFFWGVDTGLFDIAGCKTLILNEQCDTIRTAQGLSASPLGSASGSASCHDETRAT